MSLIKTNNVFAASHLFDTQTGRICSLEVSNSASHLPSPLRKGNLVQANEGTAA